jgi:two-component system chemotaxis response regulator CheB
VSNPGTAGDNALVDKRRDLIVVGASAGGVDALRAMAAGFPPDLAAPVVVVLHIPRNAPTALPAILARAGPLPAVQAEHGAPLRDGVIHVAPADHHTLVEDGHLRLSSGPLENGHRPAIDPLFRSAALACGPGAIGVVLSGTRDDGTAGLAAIVDRGGAAVVQDPDDALYSSMPASALEHVPEATAYPAAKLGPALAELLGHPRPEPAGAPDPLLRGETEIAALAPLTAGWLPAVEPSPLSCPSCHGVLFAVPGRPGPRYRCRVGHAWSPESLEEEQSAGVEDALWVALRALEERVELLRSLTRDAELREHPGADLYRGRLEKAERDAALVRGLLDPEGRGRPIER